MEEDLIQSVGCGGGEEWELPLPQEGLEKFGSSLVVTLTWENTGI